MKKLVYVLYSTLCLLHSTFAQSDSVRITHTQETNTLKNQRYVASYDYALMKNEPTKWMIKAYGIQLVDYRLGVERKLTPSFSMAIDVAYSKNAARDSYPKRWVNSAEVRWYYNMVNHIKKGKSNTNFSGNYFSLRYETAWKNSSSEEAWRKSMSKDGFSGWNGLWNTDYYSNYYDSQFSLNYGVQRRFYRFGLLDFFVSLNNTNERQIHRKVTFLDGNNVIASNYYIDPNNISQMIETYSINHWNLTTGFKLGVAFADLKKPAQTRKGEVFRSFETENKLWKTTWPTIKLTSSYQSFSNSIGYEHKIGQSAFSINTYLDLSIFNFIIKNIKQYDSATASTFISNSRNSSFWGNFSIQPRWYFLMNSPVHLRKEGNNLSGIYTGINTKFLSSYSIFKNDRYSTANGSILQFMNTGFMLGYQRKLFKNGFIDVNVSKELFFYKPHFYYDLYAESLFLKNNFVLDFKLGFAL